MKQPIKKGQLYKRVQKRADAIDFIVRITGKARAGKWKTRTPDGTHSFKEITLRHYFTLIPDS